MTEEDYDDLLMFEDSGRYTDREKAALRYTSAVLWDSSIADEKLFVVDRKTGVIRRYTLPESQ